MSHSHDHDHDHEDIFHNHAPAGKMKQAFFLAMLILAAELIFGILSNSLALLADAWHMATDVASIGLAWFALEQAKKTANKKMTFGYDRAGILAAAVNGISLVAITVWILYSAITRIMNPEPIGGIGMFIGAGIGLLVNLYIIFILNGEEDNLNVKAALLHVIGDVGASAGVIIGALVIYFTGWEAIDPILSVLIAILVAFSAWNIIKQSFRILMQAAPKNVEIDDLVETIKAISGVKSVHDLHTWTLTSGKNFLSCHVVLDKDYALSETQNVRQEITHQLEHKGIQHTTVQLEDPSTNHDDELICNHTFEHNHSHGHAH